MARGLAEVTAACSLLAACHLLVGIDRTEASRSGNGAGAAGLAGADTSDAAASDRAAAGGSVAPSETGATAGETTAGAAGESGYAAGGFAFGASAAGATTESAGTSGQSSSIETGDSGASPAMAGAGGFAGLAGVGGTQATGGATNEAGAGGIGTVPGSGGVVSGAGTAGFGGTPSELQSVGSSGVVSSAGAAGFGGTGGSVDEVRATMTPSHRAPLVHALWPYRVHSACFWNPDAASLSTSKLVERALFAERVRWLFESTWQRVADVTLQEWRNCETGGADFELVLVDDGPSRTEMGFPGMFQPREVYLWTGASDAEILYTLGRALGLGNEYGLERLPGDCVRCTQSDQCTDTYRDTCLPSGYCGSVTDNESIMAPPDCGGIESIRKFSVWDITAVRLAYGIKPIGSLVNARGTCALVEDEGNGTIDSCQGYDDGLFVQRTATGTEVADLMVSMYLPEERCLQSNPFAVPSVISYQPCDATDLRQDVRLAPARIRTIGGLCVVASPAAGTELKAEECGGFGSPAEQWIVRDSQIRLAGTTLCATVRDTEPSLGTPIVLGPCGLAPDRQTFVAKRALFRYEQDYCLNISGGLPLAGSNVILWNGCPSGMNNESFYLSGPVTLADGAQCLDADFVTKELQGAVCDSRASEEWDFYF